MKELIYLDTEYLHSFMAQKEGGLRTSIDTEAQEQITEGTNKEEGYHSRSYLEGTGKSGNFNIPGIFNTPSAGLNVRWEPGKKNLDSISFSQLEAGKEVISKRLHDDALENFERYLIENELLKKADPYEDLQIGEYIKISSPFRVIDFSFLENAMSSKLTEVMLGDDSAITEQIEMISSREGLSKAQKKHQIDNIKKQRKQQRESLDKQFDYLRTSVSYLSKLLPSDAYLKIANTVSPVKEKFLREDAKNLYFKYGNGQVENKITLVGKVTRGLNFSTDSGVEPGDLLSGLSQMTEAVDKFFGTLKIAESGDYVISPVATYFE